MVFITALIAEAFSAKAPELVIGTALLAFGGFGMAGGIFVLEAVGVSLLAYEFILRR